MKVLKTGFFIVVCSLFLSSCSNYNTLKACPPNTVIEWADMLMIDDIKYEHQFQEPEKENTPIKIEQGKELSKVTYTMADSACSNHKMQNGDATYLKEGTTIYEIKGYPTSLIVAANDIVYVVNKNNKAKTAGELYPMDKLVKNIFIESLEDGKRIHTFSQSSKDVFLDAFYELKLNDVNSLINAGKLEGTRIFLEIELTNGVSFRQLYWAESNIFHNGAIGNDQIKEVINNELLNMKK